MNMGYGFLRAIYGQKAKRPYAYLKSLYGEQLGKYLKTRPGGPTDEAELSDYQLAALRQQIQRRIGADRRKSIIIATLSVFITGILLVFVVLAIRLLFGF